MKLSSIRGRIGTTQLFVLAAIAVAVGLWAGTRWLGQEPPPELKTAVMYPAPLTIPDFELQRSDGKAFTAANLQGHWTITFFGFTHCPDICPTTLTVFKQVWIKLAAAGKTDKVQFVFVSVDPERDTAEQLARYIAFFNKDFIAATGADDQLTRLTRALGLVYAKVPDESGGYSIDHSASVVIIDPKGRRAGLFRPPFEVTPISADITSLVDWH
ncbi:MAG TPA: SCO family protein [Dokdonella sp.]|uniref:SCO family protein n=1 Tax=Dokdonella sp. TaxID=2291710 RepID=UPI002D7F0D9E|nr:SCO family protein [Dokdonella sp.]HET9031586.1 SCO family protein [Dokdonella sp.]